ncbi:MAG: hypothetical protein CSYNP_03555 [Syntrophus sp. SKADARSKE-3]|nr:hypothetical protein [Syntrophus sp. SKADARSKE-3]
MNCPICNVTLQIAERQGIEIDFCPQCRGVWLDRGELDKIIERSSAQEFSRPQQEIPARPSPAIYYERRDDRHYDKHHDDHDGNKHHKKRGFLSDLFD